MDTELIRLKALHLLKDVAKRSDFLFSLRYRTQVREYLEYKSRMRVTAHKSQDQIADEMRLVRRYWGCRPDHYIRYKLFEKKLDEEGLLDYIPPSFFYGKYLRKAQFDTDSFKFNDKKNQLDLFARKGVPTPGSLGVYGNGNVRSASGDLVKISSIINFLDEGEKIFFKPLRGFGGNGIVVLKRIGDDITCQGRSLHDSDINSIFDPRKKYLVQRGLTQIDSISEINSSCINTLRVVTQRRDGHPHMSVCVLRVGRGGSDVDNSSQGGLSVQVDVRNGKLGEQASAEHGEGCFQRHPDTQFVFAGGEIENWDEVKATVLGYASKLHEFGELAWDIALTTQGVIVIEINFTYALDLLQCCCGGLRGPLQVYPG